MYLVHRFTKPLPLDCVKAMGLRLSKVGVVFTRIQPPLSTTQSQELSRNSNGKVFMKQCT